MKRVLFIFIFFCSIRLSASITILPRTPSIGEQLGAGISAGLQQLARAKEQVNAYEREAALQIFLQEQAHQQRLQELAYQKQLHEEQRLQEQVYLEQLKREELMRKIDEEVRRYQEQSLQKITTQELAKQNKRTALLIFISLLASLLAIIAISLLLFKLKQLKK